MPKDQQKQLTTIYFIRHAKTKNPQRIVKGILPGFNLSKKGQQEVAKLGKFLRNKPIKLIFYSPLARTKQTAQIIKKFLPQAQLVADKRLLEWETSWQGHTISQIKADPQMQWKIYNEAPQKFKTKKGVTAMHIVKNMQAFVKTALKKYPGQEIVAISHADPIKLLRCYLETGKISKKFITYACSQPSITAFTFVNGKCQKITTKSFIKNQPIFLQ